MSGRIWPWLLAYVVLLAGRDLGIELGRMKIHSS